MQATPAPAAASVSPRVGRRARRREPAKLRLSQRGSGTVVAVATPIATAPETTTDENVSGGAAVPVDGSIEDLPTTDEPEP